VSKALILISCSDEKSSYQESFFQNSPVKDFFPDSLCSKLFEKRKQVYDLIIKGENRAERESNRMLCDGPDFQGTEGEPGYLPAYKRYYGRFFNQLKRKHYEQAYKLGYEILIMSALYGFITPFDSIQNYNCHLTDTFIKENSPSETKSLQEFWKDTLTECITQLIQIHPISYIVDLLSEESYQNTIDWNRLKQVEIRHRIFRYKAGSSILPNLRNFFLKDILTNTPDQLFQLTKPGYPINRYYFHKDQIAFENKIGTEPGYARESLEFDKYLYSALGKKWNSLSDSDKNALRLIEGLHKKFKSSEYKRQIAIAIIQTYWGILEKSRKYLLKSVVKSYRNSKLPIQNEIIILKNKKYKRELSFFEIKKIIVDEDCKHFQAYDTQLLFKHSLNKGSPSSQFGHYIQNKFGESQIQKFYDSYNELRGVRNSYKAIPQPDEIEIQKIEEDLGNFRGKILSKEESPIILFGEFNKKLLESD